MPVERLTWAPEADERDRIDFIYYIPATGWEVEDAVIVGPKSSIIRSQRVEEDSKILSQLRQIFGRRTTKEC